jgi:hypothetical protein
MISTDSAGPAGLGDSAEAGYEAPTIRRRFGVSAHAFTSDPPGSVYPSDGP